MTALATPIRPVLAEALLPRALTRTGVTVGLGALLTALAAQVAVPVRLPRAGDRAQTFAVLLVGAALGPGRAVASMALYLVLGVVGLRSSPTGRTGRTSWSARPAATSSASSPRPPSPGSRPVAATTARCRASCSRPSRPR